MPWKSAAQAAWGHSATGIKALGGKAKVKEFDDATVPGSLAGTKGSKERGGKSHMGASASGAAQKRGGGGYTPPHIKPSHKGLLHKDLGIAQGKRIPLSRLMQAKRSKDPAVRKRANFAINFAH